MWNRRRVFAAAGLTLAGLTTVLAGAAFAPLGSGDSSTSFAGMRITIDGVEGAVFTRCLGLGTETAVVQQNVAAPNGTTRTVLTPGNSTAGRIVCERGVTSDLTLSAWRDAVISGDMTAARKNVTFQLFDATGQTVGRWNVQNAWPSELTHHFSGTTGREIVTFVAESTTRVAP